MKKVLNFLMAIAMLATAALAANNVENPLYAPAQLGFYSKTGVGWMYKKSDDNLAMKAKDWAKETENPIPRITEDFGFGLTNWLTFRGAFGYTYDGDIDRSGMHQARLGLNFRPINSPAEAVTWDIYADAFLGGVSAMKAEIVKSKNMIVKNDTVPLSFNYENYGNGRWGVWVGTQVGKTFDKLNVAVFGEVERTFGNDNNEIKIDPTAVPVVGGLVQKSVREGIIGIGITRGCEQSGMTIEQCKNNSDVYNAIASEVESQAGPLADLVANNVAEIYAKDLPSKKFSVDTKSTWEYAAGLKTLYEIDNDWSVGGAFNWKHRATNSIKALNIKISESVDNDLINNPVIQGAQSAYGINFIDYINSGTITSGVEGNFKGSMKDGVDEFALSLLGSRAITENLQLTLYGEYTFDTAEEKAQLGTTMKAELGLRMNWQF
ncbi:hypothetical protein R83H12_01879 [Fibrobacteria bacterium R8-3-H12]